MPFAYREAGEKKAALVKVRLCEDCSRRLHYAQKRGKKAKRAEERVMDDDEAGEGMASENKRRRGDDEELVEDHASQPDANESTDKATAATSASTVWSEPSAAQRAASDNQRATSKAEEFDQFFAGMFE